MSTILIWIVTAIYSAVALELFFTKDTAEWMMWTGYAFANIGVIRALH